MGHLRSIVVLTSMTTLAACNVHFDRDGFRAKHSPSVDAGDHDATAADVGDAASMTDMPQPDLGVDVGSDLSVSDMSPPPDMQPRDMSGQNCPPLPLRAHWSLDEDLGGAFAEHVGGHQATVLGSVDVVTGKVGNAVRFTGIENALLVDHDPTFEIAEGTVTVWVKRSADRSMGIFGKDATGSRYGHLKLLVGAQGQVSCRMQDGIVDGGVTVRSSATIPIGGWRHVAVSFGPAGLRLYVDGIEQDAVETFEAGWARPGSDVDKNTEPIVIAADPGGSTSGTTDTLFDWFGGELDEVAIFDEQLSPEQLRPLVAGCQLTPP